MKKISHSSNESDSWFDFYRVKLVKIDHFVNSLIHSGEMRKKFHILITSVIITR